MYIYKTTNILNNKIYIGLSTKKSKENPFYFGSGKLIRRAISKYGKSAFNKEIIVESIYFDYTDLQFLEIYFIKQYNSTNLEIGYNISQGGDCNYGETNGMYGKTHSKDVIDKIIKTRKIKSKNNPSYGKMSEYSRNKFSNFISERNRKNPTLPNGHSEETKKKISLTIKDKIRKGEMNYNHKPVSEERKKRLSQKMKGSGNHFYGKKHTKESILKMKEARRKRNQPSCLKLDLNGNVLKKYEYLPDVKKDGFRIDLVRLASCRKNGTHKGFMWEIEKN